MPATPPEQLLRVRVTRSAENVAVHLDGELDLATAPLLDAALRPVLTEAPRRVVVDAEELSFIDIAGLAPLLEAYRVLPRGSLRMRSARPSVVRVLRLLDLAAPLGLDA